MVALFILWRSQENRDKITGYLENLTDLVTVCIEAISNTPSKTTVPFKHLNRRVSRHRVAHSHFLRIITYQMFCAT